MHIVVVIILIPVTNKFVLSSLVLSNYCESLFESASMKGYKLYLGCKRFELKGQTLQFAPAKIYCNPGQFHYLMEKTACQIELRNPLKQHHAAINAS